MHSIALTSKPVSRVQFVQDKTSGVTLFVFKVDRSSRCCRQRILMLKAAYLSLARYLDIN